MKKYFYLLAMLAVVLGATACSDDDNHPSTNVLDKPEVTVPDVKESSAVITWKAIGNATAYIYSLNNGSEQSTDQNTVQLTGLEPEKSYTFKVKAQKTGSIYFEDSDYAEITFTTTSEENRKKVQTILEMVHYQPNLMARSLASKKQYHFVAITPSFTHGEYWEAISDGIDKAASEMESYNITITKLFFDQYNNKTFDDIVRNLLDEKVDGVLIATLFTDSVIRLSQELDRNEIPYVYVDSNIEGQHQLAYFGTESYDAGVIAARLLTDKISSTSDILMARIIHSGKNDSNQGKNRREGFCHYLKETGFTGNLHEVELKINDSVYNFIKLDEIFEANATIEGGIIFNSTCYILGNYLKARGMQKVKLVGYDLIERNTQLLSDGVITALVAQRPERQGYDGIKSLCNHLLFKQTPEKVNLMPIDILLKENLKYYLNNKL